MSNPSNFYPPFNLCFPPMVRLTPICIQNEMIATQNIPMLHPHDHYEPQGFSGNMHFGESLPHPQMAAGFHLTQVPPWSQPNPFLPPQVVPYSTMFANNHQMRIGYQGPTFDAVAIQQEVTYRRQKLSDNLCKDVDAVKHKHGVKQHDCHVREVSSSQGHKELNLPAKMDVDAEPVEYQPGITKAAPSQCQKVSRVGSHVGRQDDDEDLNLHLSDCNDEELQVTSHKETKGKANGKPFNDFEPQVFNKRLRTRISGGSSEGDSSSPLQEEEETTVKPIRAMDVPIRNRREDDACEDKNHAKSETALKRFLIALKVSKGGNAKLRATGNNEEEDDDDNKAKLATSGKPRVIRKGVQGKMSTRRMVDKMNKKELLALVKHYEENM